MPITYKDLFNIKYNFKKGTGTNGYDFMYIDVREQLFRKNFNKQIKLE